MRCDTPSAHARHVASRKLGEIISTIEAETRSMTPGPERAAVEMRMIEIAGAIRALEERILKKNKQRARAS